MTLESLTLALDLHSTEETLFSRQKSHYPYHRTHGIQLKFGSSLLVVQ